MDTDKGWLAAWGRTVQRRRGWVLLGSIALLLPIGFLFTQAGAFYNYQDPITTTESGQGMRLVLDQVEGANEPTILFVFGAVADTWQDPDYQQAVEDALSPLRQDARIAGILTPYDLPPNQADGMVSRDGRHILAIVTLGGDIDGAVKDYPELRAMVASPTLDVKATGGLAFGNDFTTFFEEDLPKSEMVSLPLTLIVLLVVFGAVVAALLPVLIGILAVGGGVAMTGYLANFTLMPDWSVQVVSLIGLGVAIDYSLFIVNRFREELAAGATREDALGRAMGTSGHAVLFSGLTVAVSLGGLAFFHGLDLAAIGYAVASVVGIAVLLSMSLLPAILAFLGPRVNWLRIGWRRRSKAAKAEAAAAGAKGKNGKATGAKASHQPSSAARTTDGEGGFWHAMAGMVMRRPALFLVLVLATVAILAAPLASIRFGGFSPELLHESAESRQGLEILASEFEQQGASELLVVVDFASGAPTDKAHLASLYDFSRAAAAVPGVVGVQSIVDVDPAMDTADYQAMYAKAQDAWSPEARRLAHTTLGSTIAVVKLQVATVADAEASYDVVRAVRALDEPDGARVLVSGPSADVLDQVEIIKDRMPLALAAIVSATYMLLVIQVRSVLLPLKAVLMNFLSVAASFGLAVFIFQMGHFTELLDFTPTALNPGNLVLMFCIVFGLSMDYEVLLLSRMHEEYLKTGDNRRAVQQGLEKSGRIVTGAALIMVFVFAAFAVVRITFMKLFGVGLAFAVLFDATVIRAMLVPALMRLMGNANWWAPAWVRAPKPVTHQPRPRVRAAPDPGPTANWQAANTATQATPATAAATKSTAPTPATPAPAATTADVAYKFSVSPSFADPAVQAWYEAELQAKAARTNAAATRAAKVASAAAAANAKPAAGKP